MRTYLENNVCNDEISGNIREICVKDFLTHDVKLTRFPCQPSSLSGVSKKDELSHRLGFHCDAQGTMFFDVARILYRHRPKAFLLGIVKNHLSHTRGRAFKVPRRARVILPSICQETHYGCKNQTKQSPINLEQVHLSHLAKHLGYLKQSTLFAIGLSIHSPQ